MKKTFLVVGFLLSAATARSAELTLKGYLELVRQKNEQFQSASSQAQGSLGISREADLLFIPQFFAEARAGHDEKLPSPPTIVYDRANNSNYSLGVSQQWRSGLKAKLSYSLTDTELVGAGAVLGDNNKFAEGAAQLELSMPLWANGFGRTARANEEVSRQQAHANRYSSLSQATNLLMNAENAYWRLVAAAEQLKIEEQSLQAAKNIQDYVTQKRRKDLGETADVLQANALVEAYNLQVQQATHELRSAQREFNLFLNRDANAPAPGLESFNFGSLEGAEVPVARPGDRFDVKAGEAQAKLAHATSSLAYERNKPNLDLYGSYTTYGQASAVKDAFDRSSKFDRDGAYIGVRFSVPLNLSAQSDARHGADQNRIAAEKNLSYLRYSQEQHWLDLVQKLSDAKQTLKLSAMIEKSQKAKLDNERIRLRQGRTTTYQVLLFEQDYNKAQAARVEAASKILKLQSEAKLYQADLETGR